MKRIKVGHIHPRFWRMEKHLRRFIHESVEGGGLRLKAPAFSMIYIDGYLYSSDSLMLRDIYDLVKRTYGVRVSKESYEAKISWDQVPSHVTCVNVGVLDIPDSSKGWNGSINATWYDTTPPHPVVDTYFRYWLSGSIFDSSQLDLSYLKSLNDDDFAIHKLITTRSRTEDPSKAQKISDLIEELL